MTHDNAAGLRDAWDTNLRVEDVAWDPNKTHYLVRSAGPDKQFGTNDDLWTYVEVRRRKIVGRANPGPSTIAVNIEHDRGAFNWRAEVSGTAVDQWGGALEGAGGQLRSVLGAEISRTQLDGRGAFLLGAPPAAGCGAAVFSGSG